MSQATKSTKLVLLMVFLANLVAHTAVGMTTTSTCGGNITGAASGRVTSPRYPQVYPPNIKCQWDITTNIGTGMRLVVEHLDNKETSGGRSICYDKLLIYRYNPNGSVSLIKKLCGHSVLELTSRIIDVTSTSASTSKIAIVFTSDYATELTGFSIVYKALCNQTLEGASGTVTSPGFPSNYPRDARCTTTISTAPGTNVQLQFVDIAIHKTFLCVNDYVRVTSSTGGTGVGKPYCGNQKPNLIVSNSNDMTLEFVSDGSFGGRGFTAVWSTASTTTVAPATTVIPTTQPTTTTKTTATTPTTVPTTVSATTTVATTTIKTTTITVPTTTAVRTAKSTTKPLTTATTTHAMSSVAVKTVTPNASPSEILHDYTGLCTSTKSGKTCQRWDSQIPHKPNFAPTPSNNNYCRNPDDDSKGPWCYTIDPGTRWEYCDIANCLPTTPNPEPTTVTTLAPATTSLTSSPKPTTTNPSIVTSSTPTSTPPLIITTIGPLVPPETTSKIPITPTPITTGTERTATNASEPSTDAVAEAAGSTKEPLPWYPFLLIGLALLLVIIIVLVALIFARRRRKQGSQDATNDVVFQPMIEDDWTERPRENTYVEIPFLSSDEMATRNGHGPLYRSGSNASIDSIARAKRGLFEDTPTTTNNTTTTTTTTTTFNGGATGPPTEEPYSMALDNEGLPPNGIVAAQSPDIDDNPYQQIDYMRTEDVADIKKGSAANLVVSIPVQSASQAPAKGKKKGIRNFFGKKNAKPEPVTKKPPKVPVRTTPLRSSPESNPKSNDIRKPAVPPKNRPSIASTSQAPDVTNDDVFVPGAVGNHYQSPSSIKEKIASLNESPESEYAIASEGSFKLVEQDKPPSPSKTDDVTNKDDVGSTSENDTANKVPVPVPDSSFKVSIDPTTIDRMNGSISNDEGWYASPSSPVFEINPITSLYDRPSSLNERPQSGESYCSMSKVEAPPKPDKKSKTQKLKVKDQNGRNSGLYMQMQSQPGTHYQNLTYEKAVPSDVTAKKSDDVTK